MFPIQHHFDFVVCIIILAILICTPWMKIADYFLNLHVRYSNCQRPVLTCYQQSSLFMSQILATGSIQQLSLVKIEIDSYFNSRSYDYKEQRMKEKVYKMYFEHRRRIMPQVCITKTRIIVR